MIELEIQVLSDRREGLVMELGQVITANHYALLRQKLTHDTYGSRLSMVVRGPSEQRFALEDMLGAHSRVLSFEAALCEAEAAIAVTPPKAEVPSITTAQPPAAVPDIAQVEQFLPRLMQDFPRIYPGLVALENGVTESAREPSLFLAGRRLGVWVHRRDYPESIGLNLGDAIRRIAAPALGRLAEIEQRGVHVHVLHCPLCTPGSRSGCRFYGGYLEGLLGAAVAGKKVRVRHLSCSSDGAAHCTLEIAH
jgi:predicted hydrocarbon binding protein